MLWNVKQVAEYLSISSSMVYKLVGNFELQAIRVGDCIRFSPEAVEGFIPPVGFNTPPLCGGAVHSQ